jgi:hypothetical protein
MEVESGSDRRTGCCRIAALVWRGAFAGPGHSRNQPPSPHTVPGELAGSVRCTLHRTDTETAVTRCCRNHRRERWCTAEWVWVSKSVWATGPAHTDIRLKHRFDTLPGEHNPGRRYSDRAYTVGISYRNHHRGRCCTARVLVSVWAIGPAHTDSCLRHPVGSFQGKRRFRGTACPAYMAGRSRRSHHREHYCIGVGAGSALALAERSPAHTRKFPTTALRIARRNTQSWGRRCQGCTVGKSHMHRHTVRYRTAVEAGAAWASVLTQPHTGRHSQDRGAMADTDPLHHSRPHSYRRMRMEPAVGKPDSNSRCPVHRPQRCTRSLRI